MKRALSALVVTTAMSAPSILAQSAQFPDTPQGKLAAAFFSAANSADENVMARFQSANFSDGALKRRSPEQREQQNRELRETAGNLTLKSVVSSSPLELVLTAAGDKAPGLVLRISFRFTTGPTPKIDGVQISG